MDDAFDDLLKTLRKSHMLRLVLIGILVLVLTVPIVMIAALVRERQARERQAINEVNAKWGQAQQIVGPALVIPYKQKVVEVSAKGARISREQVRYAFFLPERLSTTGTANTETRYRGIFAVPVYQATFDVTGVFARPNFGQLGIDPETAMPERAQLALGLSDVRAIQQQATLTWNGKRMAFLPGIGDSSKFAVSGIHVNLGRDLGAKGYKFSFPLVVNGSRSISFVPFGRDTLVDLKSNWNSPSFTGNWLPTRRAVTSSGFAATWSIPYLGRDYGQAFTSQSPVVESIRKSSFGVAMFMSIDKYRMADRSVKYALLFILLTFVAIWLIEVLAGVRVHPLQYFLLGSALCVFYLLELSLSEHLSFEVAYAIAALAIIGMVATYGKVMLRTFAMAAVVGAVVAGLYAFLYVVLRNEDYALLVGSVGVFAVLGLVMFLTRKINWYGSDSDAGGQEKPFR